jgi:hypothetical protein
MSSILAQKNEARENQAQMILEMERKLNGGSFAWFKFHNRNSWLRQRVGSTGDRTVSKISVA